MPADNMPEPHGTTETTAPRKMPGAVTVDESTAYDGSLDLAGARALVPSLDRIGMPGEPDYAADLDSGGSADPVADPPALPADKQAVVDAAAGVSTPDAPVTTSQLDRAFSRLSELENATRTQQAELERLRARAARADELEAQAKDPWEFLTKNGWDQDVLAEAVLKGGAAVGVRQAKAKTEIEQLREELAAERNARLQNETRDQVSRAKAGIPALVASKATELPYTSAYFDSPEQMADAVYATVQAAAQDGRELTFLEAARAIEDELVRVEARVARGRSKKAPAAAPAPKAPVPAPKTITNANSAAPARTSEPESETFEPNFAGAVAAIRQLRAQQANQ